MMQVKVLAATSEPLEIVSLAAGNCYGKNDISYSRVCNCMRNNHMSVFEHVSATFRIDGISRACLAQLTRHRLCSFSVTSQRYVKINTLSNWYVKPKGVSEDFDGIMKGYAKAYNDALANGAKAEDARFLLPEATKTNAIVTANFRELMHVFELRGSKNAQWEIRELVNRMIQALQDYDCDWDELIELWKEVR